MNNSKLVRNIKEECKQRKIQLGVLLKNCNLNQGFLYEIEKRNKRPLAENILAIAEYLGVSVDYLLGRTDEPKGTSMKTGNNNGDNNNSSINISSQPPKYDDTTNQVAQMFSKLDIVDKTKVLSLMVELSEKKGA